MIPKKLALGLDPRVVTGFRKNSDHHDFGTDFHALIECKCAAWPHSLHTPVRSRTGSVDEYRSNLDCLVNKLRHGRWRTPFISLRLILF